MTILLIILITLLPDQMVNSKKIILIIMANIISGCEYIYIHCESYYSSETYEYVYEINLIN